MRTRLIAAVTATSVGLAFWWALTEPLPVPPVILLSVPAAILEQRTQRDEKGACANVAGVTLPRVITEAMKARDGFRSYCSVRVLSGSTRVA